MPPVFVFNIKAIGCGNFFEHHSFYCCSKAVALHFNAAFRRSASLYLPFSDINA